MTVIELWEATLLIATSTVLIGMAYVLGRYDRESARRKRRKAE